MLRKTVSIILSTYDEPEWLEKSLLGYACQDRGGFEILIADDGSGPATRDSIERLRAETGLQIVHTGQAKAQRPVGWPLLADRLGNFECKPHTPVQAPAT